MYPPPLDQAWRSPTWTLLIAVSACLLVPTQISAYPTHPRVPFVKLLCASPLLDNPTPPPSRAPQGFRFEFEPIHFTWPTRTCLTKACLLCASPEPHPLLQPLCSSLLLHNKFPPNLVAKTTINIYYLTWFLRDRNSGVAQLGCSGSGLFLSSSPGGSRTAVI